MSDPYEQMYRGAPPRQPQPLRHLRAPQYREGEPTYWPPQPGPGYQPPPGHAAPRPKRKRKIFLWVFLAVQALFILWLVVGLATKPGGPSAAAQAAQQCAHGGWQGLFKSQADCTRHYAVALNDAGDTGKAIGAGIIVLLWVVVDFFMAVGYGIYKLATR